MGQISSEGQTPKDFSIVTTDRRPLKTRSWPIFQRTASNLAKRGVSPNSISVASVIFAVLGAFGLLLTGLATNGILIRIGWLTALIGIQLRLIANLIDGMVAVEGGRASATGPLYNEVPDRVSDPILLICAGYAFSSRAESGWTAAVFALLVAYTRAIGASVGAGQLYLGPMAKQQRMAVLSAMACAGIILPSSWLQYAIISGKTVGLMEIALWTIVLGCVVTVVRRLRAISDFLVKQAGRN